MRDGDGFEDLAGPNQRGPDPGAGEELADEIARAMKVPTDRIAVEPEDEEMAWLLLDGRQVSWFNLRTASRTVGQRRSHLVRAMADLTDHIDRIRPLIEGLEPGRRYRFEYRNSEIRRNLRVKGVLRSVSGFRTAKGVAGAGWVLTIETRPAVGKPSTFHLETTTLVAVRPA